MTHQHNTQPPLTRGEIAVTLSQHARYVVELIGLSLVIGMAGYHWLAYQSWVDAFLNASMLLGGMGPVGDLPNGAAKIFAGLFALYSGLVFLAVAVLLLSPVFHRVLHRFHLEVSDDH
jgi:hypothetical protein